MTIGGSACYCWKCGAHEYRLPKCKVANNQDRIDANKKKWEEDNIKKFGGGGNYDRRQFGGGNGSTLCNNNGETNVAASGAAPS